MLKDALTRWVAPERHRRGHARAAPRRRLHDRRDHARRVHGVRRPTSSRWSASRSRAFTPEDRIGALELQNLSVADNRELLLHHLDSLRQLAPAGGDPLGQLLGVGED